jgi:hypothetical protein
VNNPKAWVVNILYNLDRLAASVGGAPPQETLSSEIGRHKSLPFIHQLAEILDKIQDHHVEMAVIHADKLDAAEQDAIGIMKSGDIMSKLTSPFNGDVKPAPSPHAKGQGQSGVACVDNPEDTSVLSTVFYQDGLSHSPAALASPMGTAIPGIGHGFKETGDK